MKRIITQTYIIALCVFTACSKDDIDKKEDEASSSDEHTYHIEIANGKTYKGGVSKVTAGVYYPVSFVEYSEEIDGKVLTGMLSEVGKFQFGIGIALDDDQNPSLQGSGPGLTFGEWGAEDKYSPAGPISMTLKNYEEHTIFMYGEEGTVASYTLTFSGKFKSGTAGEAVDVIGELMVGAP